MNGLKSIQFINLNMNEWLISNIESAPGLFRYTTIDLEYKQRERRKQNFREIDPCR